MREAKASHTRIVLRESQRVSTTNLNPNLPC